MATNETAEADEILELLEQMETLILDQDKFDDPQDLDMCQAQVAADTLIASGQEAMSQTEPSEDDSTWTGALQWSGIDPDSLQETAVAEVVIVTVGNLRTQSWPCRLQLCFGELSMAETRAWCERVRGTPCCVRTLDASENEKSFDRLMDLMRTKSMFALASWTTHMVEGLQCNLLLYVVPDAPSQDRLIGAFFVSRGQPDLPTPPRMDMGMGSNALPRRRTALQRLAGMEEGARKAVVQILVAKQAHIRKQIEREREMRRHYQAQVQVAEGEVPRPPAMDRESFEKAWSIWINSRGCKRLESSVEMKSIEGVRVELWDLHREVNCLGGEGAMASDPNAMWAILAGRLGLAQRAIPTPDAEGDPLEGMLKTAQELANVYETCVRGLDRYYEFRWYVQMFKKEADIQVSEGAPISDSE